MRFLEYRIVILFSYCESVNHCCDCQIQHEHRHDDLEGDEIPVGKLRSTALESIYLNVVVCLINLAIFEVAVVIHVDIPILTC